MKRFLAYLSLILLFTTALTFALEESASYNADNIPNPTKAGTGWVTSIGNFLSDTDIAEINRIITEIERETTVEIAVVIVPALDEDIFTTAQAIFDKWKIGKKSKDNGLLIIADMAAHAFRTHTGYGMESTFPDATIQLMQNSVVIPQFKKGNYGKGIIDYLNLLRSVMKDPQVLKDISAKAEWKEKMERFGENAMGAIIFGLAGLTVLVFGFISLFSEMGTMARNARKKYDSYSRISELEKKGLTSTGFILPLVLIPFGAIFFSVGLGISGLLKPAVIAISGGGLPGLGVIISIFAAISGAATKAGIIRRWRNDPRTCPQCGQPMKKLDEKADDQYLKPFQIKAEQIKSEDYDVWKCTSCDNKTIERYRAGFYAFYTPCPSCTGLTARQTRREVTVSPTYDHSGTAVLHFDCLSCSHHFTKTTTIPKLTRSSSSGSSGGGGGGGSSFGGGSSGGGGSTSHW